MNPKVIIILAVTLTLACSSKKFPLLNKSADTKDSSGNTPPATSQTQPAADEGSKAPVLVTGVYLACSPVTSSDNGDTVSCVMADKQRKQKVDLGMIMRHWTFDVDRGSIAADGAVTANVEQSSGQQPYHFKLSLTGGTKESRDAALKAAKVSLDYDTKNDTNARAEYLVGESGSIGDLATQQTDSSSKMGPITGTLLKQALTLSQNAKDGLLINQQIPADGQNIQLTMRGWPQPTTDHPIQASVYFGVTALVVNNLSFGFDLSFDHDTQHCNSIISFLATDKGATSAFDCH